MQRQTVAIIIVIASVRVPVSMIKIIATCVSRLHSSDQWVVNVCIERSDAPIIFPAVFTMHCRAFLVQSAPTPSDAAGNFVLNGSSAECGYNGWWSTCLLEFAQEDGLS